LGQFFLLDKGNITTYEWKYGEPPVQVEVPDLGYAFEPPPVDEDAGEIDFGDLGGDVELQTGKCISISTMNYVTRMHMQRY